MTDEIEAVGGLGLQGAGVLGLYWAIGPAVQAFGKNFGTWTDFQTQNLFKLGEKAQRRLGGRDPEDDESVHPRVAKEILFEASWISDDVHQEYLAGILVGARSLGGRSERGVQFVRMLSTMTSNQIRLHHAVYSAFLASMSDIDPGEKDRRREAQIWLPLRSFASVVTPEAGQGLENCVVEVSIALEQLDLMQPVTVGSTELFLRLPAVVPEPYFATEVTSPGLALYLSAYGAAPWREDARDYVRSLGSIGPRFDEFELRRETALDRVVRTFTP